MQAFSLKRLRYGGACLALAIGCAPVMAGIEVFTGTEPDVPAIETPEPPATRPAPQFDTGGSERLALVVSMQNYDYGSYDVLDTADADGDSMAEALRGLGYRIMRVRDADRAGLDAALSDFSDAVTEKSVIAFVYTGLGVALPAERDNRILPADLEANLPEDPEARRDMIMQGSFALSGGVLARIKRHKPAALMVFYDGCHPGPAEALGGSSCKPIQIRNAATLYAAGPDMPSLARTGPQDDSSLSVFARAVLEAFESEPSLRIASMFQAITARVQSMTENAGSRQSPVARISLSPDLRDGGLCIAPAQDGCTAEDVPEPIDLAAEQVRSEPPRGQIEIEQTPYTPFSGSPASTGPEIDVDEILSACDRFAANPGHKDNPEDVVGVAFTEIDVTKALPACLKAVEVAPDNLRMRYQLSRAKQAAKQHYEAIRDLRELAEKHNYPAAMNNLGSSYQLGLGVEQNDAEAVRWYKMAAAQEFVPSMAVLGWMYQTGKGVGKDYDAAFGWYEKAAKAGFAPAMNNLGFMYQNGWGVEADLETAADWFLKAAEMGLPPAMSMAGWLYEQGRGVDKDLAKSMEWYIKAADAGLPAAMGAVGGLYDRGVPGIPRSAEDAADWFVAAIGRQHENSRDRLLKQPETLHLDTRQAIQRALTKAGFDAGPPDGVFGERTRDAIERLYSGERP